MSEKEHADKLDLTKYFLEEESFEWMYEPAEERVKRLEALTKAIREEKQWGLLRQLSVIFAISLGYTLTLFILQGFHIGGFDLDTSLLALLGGATIGEVAGLLIILMRGISGADKGASGEDDPKS
jgi:hypothetical protein